MKPGDMMVTLLTRSVAQCNRQCWPQVTYTNPRRQMKQKTKKSEESYKFVEACLNSPSLS